jgi:FkbM family methyltransferase
VTVEPGVNLLLDPSDDIARIVLVSRTSRWEPEVWSALDTHLDAGGVFLDVGAHIGMDSLRAAVAVGPSGKVVAFEPNPITVDELRANVRESGATNVNVQPIALTDREQELVLFDSRSTGNSGSSSLSARNAGDAGRPHKVRGRRLDDVVRELGLARVDLIKADVEGAELLVLKGSTETLTRFHPALVLEVVPRQLENMGASVNALESLIRSFGYGEGHWVDYKNKEYEFAGPR